MKVGDFFNLFKICIYLPTNKKQVCKWIFYWNKKEDWNPRKVLGRSFSLPKQPPSSRWSNDDLSSGTPIASKSNVEDGARAAGGGRWFVGEIVASELKPVSCWTMALKSIALLAFTIIGLEMYFTFMGFLWTLVGFWLWLWFLYWFISPHFPITTQISVITCKYKKRVWWERDGCYLQTCKFKNEIWMGER